MNAISNLAMTNKAPAQLRQFLVIEKEASVTQRIQHYLQTLGANFDCCNNGDLGLRLALQNHWDLIIIGSRLPKRDGLDICRILRLQSNHSPIVFLSDDNNTDGLLSLESGADDYLVNPFNSRELIARSTALLRRTERCYSTISNEATVIAYDGLTIDKDKRELTVDGNLISLTSREFELVWYFATHPNKVVSRSQLLDKVWGYQHQGYGHTVDSHINRLRAKLKPCATKYIETVWGIGYRFRVGFN